MDTNENIILTMAGITKAFPGVLALDQVDFILREGEIHAVMGENGAGKSTLIKVLTGVHTADKGTIRLREREIAPKTPLEAQALGISTVYQEVNLCENLTVAENIFVGRAPKKHGLVDWKTMQNEARRLLGTLNLSIDVTLPLYNYSVAIQQMVAIARALAVDSSILILDEPTSSLDETETASLFDVLRQLRKDGMSIVFISHFLEQIYALCDRATVLRNGTLVGSKPLAMLPRYELVAMMLGRELGEIEALERKKAARAEEIVPVLAAADVNRVGKVKGLNMELFKGEVLGFAGLLGSGRTETAQLLFGAEPAETGTLTLNGEDVRLMTTKQAMTKGIALCPEDRKKLGIIGDLSVRENIILALQVLGGMFTKLPQKEQEEIADRFIKLLQIKVSSPNQIVKTLSGGNQQKVIIARWLAIQPDILIMDEPTRGIDIGTKTEIQKLMIALAKEEDKSVIFISSELEEVVRTCARVLVFRDHEKVGELSGDQLTVEHVMAAIAEEVPHDKG